MNADNPSYVKPRRYYVRGVMWTALFLVVGVGAEIGFGELQSPATWHGYQLNQLHAACQTGLGQVSQALSANVATDCSTIDVLNIVSYCLLGAGIVLVLLAAVRALVLLARGLTSVVRGFTRDVGQDVREFRRWWNADDIEED